MHRSDSSMLPLLQDHPLQLKAFAAALNKASGREPGVGGDDFTVDWRLKLVGSSRHKEDEKVRLDVQFID